MNRRKKLEAQVATLSEIVDRGSRVADALLTLNEQVNARLDAQVAAYADLEDQFRTLAEAFHQTVGRLSAHTNDDPEVLLISIMEEAEAQAEQK